MIVTLKLLTNIYHNIELIKKFLSIFAFIFIEKLKKLSDQPNTHTNMIKYVFVILTFYYQL